MVLSVSSFATSSITSILPRNYFPRFFALGIVILILNIYYLFVYLLWILVSEPIAPPSPTVIFTFVFFLAWRLYWGKLPAFRPLPQHYFPPFWCRLLSLLTTRMPPSQADKDGKKQEMIKLSYCSMRAAQKPSSWDKLTRVQTKELNPAVVFTILGKWLGIKRFQQTFTPFPLSTPVSVWQGGRLPFLGLKSSHTFIIFIFMIFAAWLIMILFSNMGVAETSRWSVAL